MVNPQSGHSVALHSAVYEGWVRHRRSVPREHAFRYRMFMLYLDLAEIERVFEGRWLWSVGRRNVVEFRRGDYHGGDVRGGCSHVCCVDLSLARTPDLL